MKRRAIILLTAALSLGSLRAEPTEMKMIQGGNHDLNDPKSWEGGEIPDEESSVRIGDGTGWGNKKPATIKNLSAGNYFGYVAADLTVKQNLESLLRVARDVTLSVGETLTLPDGNGNDLAIPLSSSHIQAKRLTAPKALIEVKCTGEDAPMETAIIEADLVELTKEGGFWLGGEAEGGSPASGTYKLISGAWVSKPETLRLEGVTPGVKDRAILKIDDAGVSLIVQ
jgi:hypothetical protein